VDVDAEHIERQAKRYEQERDEWERKYEVRFCLALSFAERDDVGS
jgi:hypothetical protein